MKEFVSSLSPKGQITIPAEIRKRLGLRPGQQVVIVWEEDGTVRLARPRYPDLAALRGAAGSLPRPVPWPELRRTAREDHLAGAYNQAEAAAPAAQRSPEGRAAS